jgi:hypothetical protein
LLAEAYDLTEASVDSSLSSTPGRLEMSETENGSASPPETTKSPAPASKNKERSPNYPVVPLTEALRLTQKLYEKERRTAVPSEIAARALGYGALSGPARSTLASLRQFGLVDDTAGGLRVSDVAMQILHHPLESPERAAALQKAALKPPLVAELAKTHIDASDHAIRAYLVTQRRFSPEGAGRFVTTFRDALKFAKLVSAGYAEADTIAETDGLGSANGPGSVKTNTPLGSAPNKPITRILFSGILSKGVTAEVSVTGDVRPEHVERLRKHLDLAKDALADELVDSEDDDRF